MILGPPSPSPAAAPQGDRQGLASYLRMKVASLANQGKGKLIPFFGRQTTPG